MITKKEHFARFKGARMTIEDDGAPQYEPWDDIVINVAQIGAFYDHTIMIMGHKIRVMETLEEIRKKVGG